MASGRCTACGWREPVDALWLPRLPRTIGERLASFGPPFGCGMWLALLGLGGAAVGWSVWLALVPVALAMAFWLFGAIANFVHDRRRTFLALDEFGYGWRRGESAGGRTYWTPNLAVAVLPARQPLPGLRIRLRKTRAAEWWTGRKWLKFLAKCLGVAAVASLLAMFVRDNRSALCATVAIVALLIAGFAVARHLIRGWLFGRVGLLAFTQPWRQATERGWGTRVDFRGLSAEAARSLFRDLRRSEAAAAGEVHVITQPPHCVRCAYDRTGLSPRRPCPECGWPSRELVLAVEATPNDVRFPKGDESLTKAQNKVSWRESLGGLLVFAVLGLGVATLIFVRRQLVATPLPGVLQVLVAIAAGLGVCVLAILIYGKLRPGLPIGGFGLLRMSPRGVRHQTRYRGLTLVPWDGLTNVSLEEVTVADEPCLRLLAAGPGDAGLAAPAADVIFRADAATRAALERRLERWAFRATSKRERPASAEG